MPVGLSSLPVSDGAVRAFKKELEGNNRLTLEPGSLAGSAMDVSPSSSKALDPTATGRVSESDALAASPARRKPRGTLLLVLVTLATLVALVLFFRLFVQR